MAEKRSVYLTDAALAMPRRLDSLSGRINQALERYAWILARDGPRIRAVFTDAQWLAIVDASRRWRELRANELPGAVLADLSRLQLPHDVSTISDSDLVILADLAEGDL